MPQYDYGDNLIYYLNLTAKCFSRNFNRVGVSRNVGLQWNYYDPCARKFNNKRDD